MTKKCSKNELFNVERQFLESCTSDFKEMNKVKFQSISNVEMEYSLIKFAVLLTSSVERLSINQVNPRVPVWLEFDHISTFDIGKLTLPKVNARFDQFCAKNHLSTSINVQ